MKKYFLTQTDEKTAQIVKEFLCKKSLYVLRSQIRGHMGMPRMQSSDKSYPYKDSQKQTTGLHVSIPKRNKSKLCIDIKHSDLYFKSISPIYEKDPDEFTFNNRNTISPSPIQRRTQQTQDFTNTCESYKKTPNDS